MPYVGNIPCISESWPGKSCEANVRQAHIELDGISYTFTMNRQAADSLKSNEIDSQRIRRKTFL
jgi:hypothetical protein